MIIFKRDEVDRSLIDKGEKVGGWGERHNSYGGRSSSHSQHDVRKEDVYILSTCYMPDVHSGSLSIYPHNMPIL